MLKKILVTLCLFFSFVSGAFASEADILVAQGERAYAQADYQRAAYLFNKAILSEPDRSDLFLRSARVWLELDQYHQALEDLDECIRLSPTNAEAYGMRGYLLQMVGEHEKALQDINYLVALYPENILLYYLRALVYEQTEEFELAIADYSEALRLTAELNKRRNNENILMLAEVSELPALDKEGAALYFARAMAQSKNGNFSEAKKDFKKAAKLNQDFLEELPEGIIA